MFGGGSSKANDSTEPENWVWKKLLTRTAEKINLIEDVTGAIFFNSLTTVLSSYLLIGVF